MDTWREAELKSSALRLGVPSGIAWRAGVLCRSEKVTAPALPVEQWEVEVLPPL